MTLRVCYCKQALRYLITTISLNPFVHHMIGQAKCSFNKSKNKNVIPSSWFPLNTTDLCLIIPVLMAVIPEALIIEVCVDSLQSAITLVTVFSSRVASISHTKKARLLKGSQGWRR